MFFDVDPAIKQFVFVDVERRPSPLLSDGDPVMCLPAQCVIINSISCHVTPLSEGPKSLFYRHCVLWLEGSSTAVIAAVIL